MSKYTRVTFGLVGADALWVMRHDMGISRLIPQSFRILLQIDDGTFHQV